MVAARDEPVNEAYDATAESENDRANSAAGDASRFVPDSLAHDASDP
jgi:hypothetical protein